jgi:hypothetical protein
LAHISPKLASPEGEGFQTSPKETLISIKGGQEARFVQ